MVSNLRRLCLVGVRGVGKTTLLKSVLPRLPRVEHIVGSAVLRELAGPDFVRFDFLPASSKVAYRQKAIVWMERRQAASQRHLLCDGHTALLDESTGRVESVFTASDCGFFRELILMEGPEDLILRRRQGDTSKRRSLNPSVIAAELEAERRTAHAISAQWGLTLHSLPSEPVAAAERLVEILS